jgi:hypothetical protein
MLRRTALRWVHRRERRPVSRAASRQEQVWRNLSREQPQGAMLIDAEVHWYGPWPHQVQVGRRRARLMEEMH